MTLLVGAAVAGLLVVLVVGVVLVIHGFSFAPGTCAEAERKAYAEFPQYGGVDKVPEASAVGGGCAIYYDTRSSQEQVAAYYTEQLKAHGWEVEQSEHVTTVFDVKKRTFEEVEVTARRGDFFYSVLFESHAYYDPPRPGVHVAVHVFENKNAPPPCGAEEKAVLAEFPQYGGKEVGQELLTSSQRGKPVGYCATAYLAHGASEEQVLGYYEDELTERGWEVQRFPTDRGGRVEGDRDGLRYEASYSRFPEERATDVRIEVYRVGEVLRTNPAHSVKQPPRGVPR
jgi:hypothetical protein